MVNARKGIKTTWRVVRPSDTVSLKMVNARKGIKTKAKAHLIPPRQRRLKMVNARKGIKTMARSAV